MSALERLRFNDGHSGLEEEHIARYRYAAKFVSGQKVLDIACGTGYGSRLLQDAGAASVTGIDISPEAIDDAKSRHATNGTIFSVGDAQNLSGIGDDTFDTIVSFETIEHVPDDRLFLREMVRVLKPGGYFIVSTPDFRLGTIRQRLSGKLRNQFHVREYVGDDFLLTLKERFDVVEVCGQKWANGWAVLLPNASALKLSAYLVPGTKWKRRVHDLFNPIDTEVVPRKMNPTKVPMFWTVRCVKPQSIERPI